MGIAKELLSNVATAGTAGAVNTGLGAVNALIGGAINQKFEKEAEERQWSRQLDMYNMTKKDNSPEARRKQLEDAGLSVGLMYGSSGTGGGAGQSQTPTKGSVNTRIENADVLGLMTQKKQIELLEAQKRNTDADTENKLKGTPKIVADTENIQTDTGVKKADIALKELQANSIKIANEFNVENNKTLLSNNIQLLKQNIIKSDVAEATKEDMIEQVRINVEDTLMNILKKDSEIQNNRIQRALWNKSIEQISNSITVANKQLVINEEQVENAWKIAALNAKSGYATKEIRGILDIMKNAIKGTTVDDK